MTVEVDQSVEEVAHPSESETQQDVQQEEARTAPERQISDQEHNWAEARRKMNELERRAAEQEEVIRRMQARAEPVEEDELAKLAEDDIITVKQAKSIGQRMAREVAEEVIREREAATAEDRLKAKYPDYDDVVTKENVELLKQQDPELAQSLYALANDPYAQAVAAYKLLKRTGVGEMTKQQVQKAKVLENSRKPGSVQSVTKSSAIGNVANYENRRLNRDLRSQLWSEMKEAAKSA